MVPSHLLNEIILGIHVPQNILNIMGDLRMTLEPGGKYLMCFGVDTHRYQTQEEKLNTPKNHSMDNLVCDLDRFYFFS